MSELKLGFAGDGLKIDRFGYMVMHDKFEARTFLPDKDEIKQIIEHFTKVLQQENRFKSGDKVVCNLSKYDDLKMHGVYTVSWASSRVVMLEGYNGAYHMAAFRHAPTEKSATQPKSSNAFNLERALAGDKVTTRDGREVTQITVFEGIGGHSVVGVLDADIESWTESGHYHSILNTSESDLVMAPKVLKGFIGINKNGCSTGTFTYRDELMKEYEDDLVAIIDLSTTEQGYEL